MLAKLRSRITYANVVSTMCLFMLLGGSAYAAATLKTNGVLSRHIKDGQVTTRDVRNSSLLAQDFKPGQLPRGDQGLQGPRGEPGQDGQDGSPDAGPQILEKLAGIDGTGSGLDADQLDGKNSNRFLGASLIRFDGVSTVVDETGGYGTATATCPENHSATGGGYRVAGEAHHLRVFRDMPEGNTWVVEFWYDEAAIEPIRMYPYVICAPHG